MQVCKWGDSLAIRLPVAVVDALDLKDGDHIEVRVAGPREFEIRPEPRRQQAIEALGKFRWSLPPDFRFDREEAHER